MAFLRGCRAGPRIRRVVPIVWALVGIMENASAQPAAAEDLDDFRWQHRILLIGSSENTSALENELRSSAAGVNERQLLWFIFSDEGVRTNYSAGVSEQFAERVLGRFPGARDAALLIGKDGGVKSTSEALDILEAFRSIDAMPMRRREMRDNSYR